MKDLTLQASKRNILGKKTRFLRRQGITPTHLFGHGLESLHLQCDTVKLQRIIAQAGTTRLVSLEIEGDEKPRSIFIREIQRDPPTRALLHVDFYQVRMEERIKVDGLLDKYPDLKGFYWAKEKIKGIYRQESREEAKKILDAIIFNLKSDDDGELVRWSNALKRWRESLS